MLRHHGLQGIDLDIEESMTLPDVTRLIMRLRADFGARDAFTITLAPVATALLPMRPWLTTLCRRLLTMSAADMASLPDIIACFMRPGVLLSAPHMSGFNHFTLEASPAGREIGWYNAQFYNGWGDASSTLFYQAIAACGWDPARVCLGVLTNPTNGPRGHVPPQRLAPVVAELRGKYGDRFGGVMGWEFFNAGTERGAARENWEWVREMGETLGLADAVPAAATAEQERDITTGLQQTQLASPTSAGPDQQAATAAAPATAFPEEHVERLVELGFERAEALAALEAMNGNVDEAATLLFGESDP